MMEENLEDERSKPATQAKPFDPASMLHSHHVLATSVQGDLVWQICQPVLEFLIDNGDPEAQAKAIETRAYFRRMFFSNGVFGLWG